MQQSDAGASLPGFFVRLKDSPLQQPQQQPPDERPAPLPLSLSRIIQAKEPLKGTGKALIMLQVVRGDGSETIARVRRGQGGERAMRGRNMTGNPRKGRKGIAGATACQTARPWDAEMGGGGVSG